MDACHGCGGELSPGLSWCPRCYAPVAGSEQGATPLWVRTQMRDREPPAKAVYSRWRAGPTSLGLLGRVLLSICVLVGSVVGYPLARGGILAAAGFDIPGKGFQVMYAVVAAIISLFLLARIWRRARVA
jgi:hypothetical protein